MDVIRGKILSYDISNCKVLFYTEEVNFILPISEIKSFVVNSDYSVACITTNNIKYRFTLLFGKGDFYSLFNYYYKN